MGNNANEGAGFGTFNASGESEAQFQIGLSQIVCPVSAEIMSVILTPSSFPTN